MRILPIITNSYIGINKKNQYNSSEPNLIGLSSPLQTDTVSFSARTRTKFSEPLKALMHYGVPDGWSGLYVIPNDISDKMFEKHIYSKTLRNLIKAIKPYEDRLFDIEYKFFTIVKNIAKNNPHYRLEDVIRVLAPEHKKRLLEEQAPILSELSTLALEMPKEQYIEFNKLMGKIKKQILQEPFVLPFNLKEFREQLHFFTATFAKKHKSHEFNIMRKVMHIAKKIPEESTNKESMLTSKAKRKKRTNIDKKLQRKRVAVLNQIEKIISESVLQNDIDLMRLIIQTRSKIYNMPILIPFDRQIFIKELQKITESLEDRKLANRINKTAVSLPTPHDSLSAFIMKQVEMSSDKIGYNMLNSSVGSIDHLIPFSKGGKNCLENYAITTNRTNSDRAHKSITEQLRLHPESYAHWQKQIDRLIELCNEGVFKKVKLSKFYIPTLAKTLFRLSPEEKPLIVNIDKLK